MHEIKFLVEIDAEPSRVFEALTQPDRLSAWWTRCDGQPTAGSETMFRFEPAGGFAKMRIEELVPGGRVQWTCVDQDFQGSKDWIGTTILFSLSPRRGGTSLDFAHTGWNSTKGIYAACISGWAHFLKDSLKKYLETGKGEPHSQALAKKA